MDFFIKNKKIFLILGFLMISVIIAYFIFLVFFKPFFVSETKEPGEKTSTSSESSGFPSAKPGSGNIEAPDENNGLPTDAANENQNQLIPSPIAQGGLTKTTDLNQTNSLTAAPGINGADIQYYNEQSGKFYKINKEGVAEELSDKVFHNIQAVTWSPTLNKAILEYPDGANVLYNFEKKTQVTLPSHWKDFDFSPDGNNIIMKIMSNDEDNRFLAVSSDDGAKIQPIEHLGDKDATVFSNWSPNNQIVAMYTEGVNFDKQEVFFIGKNNENFKSATIEGRGFQPKWSPSGEKLLYSAYSNNSDLKPELWVVNTDGDNIGSGRKKINLQTWADKCTFANASELYCAVPDQLEEGAGMFPEMAKETTDRLFKIDVQTGLKKLVAIPDGNYNMTNIVISDNGYNLYFTDELSKKLHKIKLK